MPIMTICVAYHDHMYGLTRPYVWVNATICVDSDAYFRWKALLLRQKGGLIAYLRSMFPLVGDYQTKVLSPIREYFNQKERLHKISLTHARMLFRSRPHPVTRPGQGYSCWIRHETR